MDQLDKHITDLGGLIALVLALVTVFTTIRSTRAAARRSQVGLKREAVLGELLLDIGLFVLTLGVIVAASPLFVGSVNHLAFAHQRGVLRSTFALVWILLIPLAAWQLTILRTTGRTTWRVWNPQKNASGRRETGTS